MHTMLEKAIRDLRVLVERTEALGRKNGIVWPYLNATNTLEEYDKELRGTTPLPTQSGVQGLPTPPVCNERVHPDPAIMAGPRWECHKCGQINVPNYTDIYCEDCQLIHDQLDCLARSW